MTSFNIYRYIICKFNLISIFIDEFTFYLNDLSIFVRSYYSRYPLVHLFLGLINSYDLFFRYFLPFYLLLCVHLVHSHYLFNNLLRDSRFPIFPGLYFYHNCLHLLGLPGIICLCNCLCHHKLSFFNRSRLSLVYDLRNPVLKPVMSFLLLYLFRVLYRLVCPFNDLLSCFPYHSFLRCLLWNRSYSLLFLHYCPLLPFFERLS